MDEEDLPRMAADTGYDTSKLQALRLELARFNAAAVKSGLLRPADVPKPPPRAKDPPRSSKAASRRGKDGARRLLAILRRHERDLSPDVLGTDFTEDGIVRLMAHLRKPRSRQSRFLLRIERFLLRPSAYGVRTSAGVSVERLQLVSRRLLEIEAVGFLAFQARRAARRTHRADLLGAAGLDDMDLTDASQEHA